MRKKNTQKPRRTESHAKLQSADFFFILPFLKVTNMLTGKFTISKKIIMQIFYRSFSIYNEAVHIKPVNNKDSAQELTVNFHL